jgi:hypothetical protein
MRFARIIAAIAPLLAALTLAFGGLHLYYGIVAARAGNWPFALFYAVFGIAGIALAVALWRVRRQISQLPK